MHAVSRIGATLLVVLSLLAPAMVCAMPGSQMTAAEHACCKLMKGKCGSMRMPDSHNCCQTTVGNNRLDVLQPHSASFQVHVAILAIATRLSVPGFPLFACHSIDKLDHSPPPAYQPSPSVLRI